MKNYLAVKILIFYLFSFNSTKAADSCSILVISNSAAKHSKLEKFKILYGSEESAKKAFGMLSDPQKLFRIYRCDQLIVAYNAQNIDKEVKGSLAKIVQNCKADFNVFFVVKGITYSAETKIDVSDLIAEDRIEQKKELSR